MRIKATIEVELEVALTGDYAFDKVKKGLEYMFESGVQMELEERDEQGEFIGKVITIEPIKCIVTAHDDE